MSYRKNTWHGRFAAVALAFACIAADVTALDPSAFVASEVRTHTEIITGPSATYPIHLGGTADMDNTTTNGYSGYVVAFQPNVSVVMENIGDTPVVDPFIVVNGLRDWRTIESIIAEATRGASSDQERILMLYEFARSNRYHNYPLFLDDELHDPVRHFNIYNAGFCDDMGSVTCALAYRAGFNAAGHGLDPVNRSMHGHVMSEVPLDGRLQFIDTDENAYYLGYDNKVPVSGDDIVRDSYLASREYTYGPIFRSWDNRDNAAALLGRDDTPGRSIVIGHEMHLTLRPGERLTLRWDNIGKLPNLTADRGRYGRTGAYHANSFLDYSPPLEGDTPGGASGASNVRIVDGALTGMSGDAFAVYGMESPWVMCGGSFRALFSCGDPKDAVTVSVSVDGERWSEVWRRDGAGDFRCEVALDDSLGVNGPVPVYRYLVRVGLSSSRGSAAVRDIGMHADLLTSPMSLPRLGLGVNEVRYTDRTPGRRRIRITHTWRESGTIQPPEPPRTLYPLDGEVNRDDWIPFAWTSVEGCDTYRLRVSRTPDLRLPYRPCYDLVLQSTVLTNERTGLFNPGETYYWSVRARTDEGLWGEWGPVRSFTWQGPRPPVDLAVEDRGGRLWLTWKPDPRDPPPARYEVYASDVRGFTPMREEHEVRGLGEMPSNLVGSTTVAGFPAVSWVDRDQAPNRSSLRVVAVDANGTRGGPSAPVELEHPFIYSRPPEDALVGEEFSYLVKTLRSLGDLQYRYEPPGYAFWEQEGYEFHLWDAPGWMRIDPLSGLIGGTPGEYDEGVARVHVVVRRTWPKEVTAGDPRNEPFLKDDPRFQAMDEQVFTLRVVK